MTDVTSVFTPDDGLSWANFLYASVKFALTAELEQPIKAVGMRFNVKILQIYNENHLTSVIILKVKWYSHVTRSNDIAKPIMKATIHGKSLKGKRRIEKKVGEEQHELDLNSINSSA